MSESGPVQSLSPAAKALFMLRQKLRTDAETDNEYQSDSSRAPWRMYFESGHLSYKQELHVIASSATTSVVT